MGGKGGSSPAPPDYGPVAAADSQAAQQQFQLGQDQLQWGKDQFNQEWPYAQQFLQQQTASSAAETSAAGDQQSFYDQTYKPIEQQYAGEAAKYNSPAQANANAGSAMADVASTFDQNRSAALSNLESYGIDPSQTRFGALDLSTRIGQAAATAAAGTQSRLNTQATGLALQGEAINVGRGYPSAIANSYNTATNSGKSGIDTANNTTATGASIMGTPTQYMGLGNQSLGNQGNVMVGAGNVANQAAANNNSASGNTAAGIGSLIGGVASVAAIAI